MKAAAEASDTATSETRNMDVVVIDDDESMCRGCWLTLDQGGYSTAVARNGTDGLRLIKNFHPPVVLVDLKMPGMSGEEVLAGVREIDPTSVAVVITGYGSIESAVESMKRGAFDFLTKPFEPERLIETVQRAMKLSRLRKDTLTPAAPMAPASAPAVDRHSLLLRGLETLSSYYALGLEKQHFLDELKYLEAEAKYHSEQLRQIKRKEEGIEDVVRDLRVVDSVIERHGYEKGALLQVLLELQLRLNWLPRHVLRWVAERLNVPLARVYTIANFYEAFSLAPRGKHIVQVCLGTACHVRGAQELLARVTATLGVEPGQTDPQMQFTLQTVHCMGCCALAPVMKIDGDYFSNPSLKKLKKIVATYKEEEAVPCQN